MLFGVHCSIRRGYLGALGEAVGLGCGAMQLFAYRRHQEPRPEELDDFRRARAASPVRRLLVHARYLPYLGFADEDRRRASVGHLRRELSLAEALGADAFVLHPGAYAPGDTLEGGLERCVRSVNEGVKVLRGPLAILFENVAGGGRRMGASPDELERLVAGARAVRPAAGLCLDTAHAWSAGHDMSAAAGALGLLEELGRRLGKGAVQALHLNDTTADLGSRKENHCGWGEGRLGSEGLAVLLSAPELAQAAAILETPKGDDRRNLDYVMKVADEGPLPREKG